MCKAMTESQQSIKGYWIKLLHVWVVSWGSDDIWMSDNISKKKKTQTPWFINYIFTLSILFFLPLFQWNQ